MPRRFFHDFVEAAVQDWRERRNSKVRAINAITQTDVMAERMFNYLQAHSPAALGTAKRCADYRSDLRTRWHSLGIVWDAHDTHKHGLLTSHKSVRLITRGQDPKLVVRRGAFGTSAFGTRAFGAGEVEICLQLDDGTTLPINNILTDALKAWEAELKAVGL